MIIQLTIFRCDVCEDSIVNYDEPDIWSDPLISPPEGWDYISTGENVDDYKFCCAKCLKDKRESE